MLYSLNITWSHPEHFFLLRIKSIFGDIWGKCPWGTFRSKGFVLIHSQTFVSSSMSIYNKLHLIFSLKITWEMSLLGKVELFNCIYNKVLILFLFLSFPQTYTTSLSAFCVLQLDHPWIKGSEYGHHTLIINGGRRICEFPKLNNSQVQTKMSFEPQRQSDLFEIKCQWRMFVYVTSALHFNSCCLWALTPFITFTFFLFLSLQWSHIR